MKSILHADDHPMIRTAIRIMIESHLPETSFDEACDGDSAFEKIRNKDYDLVILDVSMPGTDSLGLIGNILAEKPETKILMLSMNAEEAYAKKYFKSGAMGYITKDAPLEQIEEAVSTVLNNKKYTSPYLTQILTDEALGISQVNPFDALSQREFEIVQHLAHGESLAEISRVLNLHVSTIGNFKHRIFEKLKCNNLISLSELAKNYKILPAA
jgi:two-component system, NarL family, invasion response regulator UvrY